MSAALTPEIEGHLTCRRSSHEPHHEPARTTSHVRQSRPRPIPSRSIDRLLAVLFSRPGSPVCTPLCLLGVLVLLQTGRRTLDLPFSERNPDMTGWRYQSGNYSTLAYRRRHMPRAPEMTKSPGSAGLTQRSPRFGRPSSPRPCVQNHSLRSGDFDLSKPLCSKAGVHAAPGIARTRTGRVV